MNDSSFIGFFCNFQFKKTRNKSDTKKKQIISFGIIKFLLVFL